MLSADSTREYDLFGPWVDEVRSEDEVPRLYRRHGLDLEAARLVLKVPRDIARRDARPDMDLYDHLVALEPERLTVLSRQPPSSEYAVRQVVYRDVVAIEDVVTLLDARLRVHCRGGEVITITYNGADRGHPARLVDELRILATHEHPESRVSTPAWAVVLEQTALGRDDIGIVNAHRAVAAARPELRALGWHPRQRVRPAGAGVVGTVARLAHVLRPMTLDAAVVAADDRTLEVFHRSGLARGRSPVHTQARLIVSRHAVREVSACVHDAYPEVSVVSLHADAAVLTLAVPTASPARTALLGLVDR